VLGFVAAFVWSWRIAQIKPIELIKGAPQGLALAREFATPDIFTRPTSTVAISAPLVVPCGAAAPTTPGDAGITLSAECGAAGDPLTISGVDMPPDRTVSIRWDVPDGAYLRVRSNCCDTDDQGVVRLEKAINPILEIQEGQTESGRVEITYEEVAGRL